MVLIFKGANIGRSAEGIKESGKRFSLFYHSVSPNSHSAFVTNLRFNIFLIFKPNSNSDEIEHDSSVTHLDDY
jgi:hypothetical protein